MQFVCETLGWMLLAAVLVGLIASAIWGAISVIKEIHTALEDGPLTIYPLRDETWDHYRNRARFDRKVKGD